MRWSRARLDWIPAQGSRRPGRPDFCWEDDIDAFFKPHLECDEGSWKEFAGKAFGEMNMAEMKRLPDHQDRLRDHRDRVQGWEAVCSEGESEI